ncbi:FAD-dependent monooxygenase [Hyphomonas johnsonii]|nr:FAD-dependent monooxygenase [Hyphomonas johnsonii]
MVDIPVLIVGGGPVGLMGAHLFDQRGISALVAERYPGRLGAPKAHALNARSLEICCAAGLPMDDIHAARTAADEGAFVRFVTNLSGQEIGRLPYERQDDAVREYTPWPLINIQQPRFERILEKELEGKSHVRLQRQLEWLGCDAVTDSVVSRLHDHASGQDITLRSRYLIGADGAASQVRDAAAITMKGPGSLAHNVSIHFEADLSEVVKDRPAILYFMFGLGTGTVLIAYDIKSTWVLMHSYNPARESYDHFDTSTCERLVRQAIGRDVPFTIKGINPWTMAAQVASEYRSRNIFLAGDAAHRFPPSGGLGLNTGLADIENLAWKIAAVERGEAGDRLLNTYDEERRYVAKTNTGQSVANSMRMRVLLQALGQEFGKDLDGAGLSASLSDPSRKSAIDAAVLHQKEHFDSLRLQLGYIYGDKRDMDEGSPIDRYEPKAVVGAYLPHTLLDTGRSTHDLVEPVGLTLIAAPDAEVLADEAWDFDMPVTAKIEGRDFEVSGAPWWQRMGIGRDGWLLVRPDRHILLVGKALTSGTATLIAQSVSEWSGGAVHPCAEVA